MRRRGKEERRSGAIAVGVAGKEKEVRCNTRKFLAKRKEVVLPFKNWPHDATWAKPVLVNINYGKFLGIPFFNLFPLL